MVRIQPVGDFLQELSSNCSAAHHLLLSIWLSATVTGRPKSCCCPRHALTLASTGCIHIHRTNSSKSTFPNSSVVFVSYRHIKSYIRIILYSYLRVPNLVVWERSPFNTATRLQGSMERKTVPTKTYGPKTNHFRVACSALWEPHREVTGQGEGGFLARYG